MLYLFMEDVEGKISQKKTVYTTSMFNVVRRTVAVVVPLFDLLQNVLLRTRKSQRLLSEEGSILFCCVCVCVGGVHACVSVCVWESDGCVRSSVTALTDQGGVMLACGDRWDVERALPPFIHEVFY